MIRKALTALLCLLLVLALPFASLAATEYTISAVPGDDLASVEAVKDLLDVLSLRFLCGEQSGMLTIALSDTDALNLALRADAEGIYAQCAALNDKALFFDKDDLVTLLSTTLKQSGAEGEMASAMVQSIEQVFTQIGMEQGTVETGEVYDVEKQLAQVEEMFAKDPAMADFCNGILGKIKITDGEYADPAHDTATQLFETSITNEDLIKLADSTTVQKVMTADKAMTAEEAKAQFTKMLEGVEYNVPVAVYTSETSGAIVAFRIPMTAKGSLEVTTTEDGKTTTETKEVNIEADMKYDRLTGSPAVDHHLVVSIKSKDEAKALAETTLTADEAAGQYELTGALSVADDGAMKEAMSMKGALTKSAEKDVGWLGFLSGGTQMTIGYSCVNTGEDSDKSLDIYTRSNAVSILEPSPSDRPLITLKVTVARDASEDALTAVNAATPENSDQLLQMTSAEQEAFFTELQTKGMQVLMSVLSLLPASVMSVFMGGSN